MVFAATITTPANTAKADAVETIMPVTKGLIWLIEVNIPSGVYGLTHMQLFDGTYQLFPASPGESITGDGVIAKYDDIYFKNYAPFELTVKTWNVDTVYDHTFHLRIGMASSEAYMARYLPSMSWENFQVKLDQAIIDQERVKADQLRVLISQIKGE